MGGWIFVMDGIPTDLHEDVIQIAVDAKNYPDNVDLYCITANNYLAGYGSRLWRALDVFRTQPYWYPVQTFTPYSPLDTDYSYFQGVQPNPNILDNGFVFSGCRAAVGDCTQAGYRTTTKFGSLIGAYSRSTGFANVLPANITYNGNDNTLVVTHISEDDPTGSGIDYAVSWKLDNNGALLSNWIVAYSYDSVEVTHSRIGNTVYMCVVGNNTGPTVYATRIYKSTNGGSSYVSVYNTAVQNNVSGWPQQIGVSEDANYVMFCTEYGLHRSSNGGSIWTVDTGANAFCVRRTGISPLFWFSGQQGGSLKYTTDFGANWNSLSSLGISGTPNVYQMETLIGIK
jgi:hypothetical protein